MTRITFIIIFSFLSCIICYAQDEAGSFKFEGNTRHYEVYLPQNDDPNLPVVLALHGYSETIKWFKDYTLFHEFADTSGFILVYPEGSIASNGQPGWNTGLRNHPFGQQNTTSNDVGFLSALIDTINAHYDIDLTRIYCCGYSMGGEMTYRMAIEKGHLFAAYASVSGKLNDISANLGPPVQSYPILHFHGTDDNVETYDGENDGNLWPVEETIIYWLENNNCTYQADTISLPNLNPSDGSTVQKISYLNCSNEDNITFFKILGAGHGWPGSTEGMYNNGKPNRDIKAIKEIWNFFKDYEKSASIDTIPTVISDNFEFEGLVRNYEVHIPPNYQTNMPAVLCLHGGTDDVEMIKNYSLLHEYGNNSGFLTIYPAANGSYWNTGNVPSATANDVGFISNLIDTLISKYEIDTNRIYCCGFGQGGAFSYKLAGEISDRLTAVA